MNKALMAGLMAMAGFGAAAAPGAERNGCGVTVYLWDQRIADPVLLMRAEALTSRMFAGIGVRLRWAVGAPRPARGRQACAHTEVMLRFASRTPPAFHPGAVAYASLSPSSSDVRVTIFYDRAFAPVVGDFNGSVALLGHVLAHEITHVLQSVARHSEEGVMKAAFTPEDRVRMRSGPLPFTDLDAELIRAAIAGSKGTVRTAVR
jgi:hypothetical protein